MIAHGYVVAGTGTLIRPPTLVREAHWHRPLFEVSHRRYPCGWRPDPAAVFQCTFDAVPKRACLRCWPDG